MESLDRSKPWKHKFKDALKRSFHSTQNRRAAKQQLTSSLFNKYFLTHSLHLLISSYLLSSRKLLSFMLLLWRNVQQRSVRSDLELHKSAKLQFDIFIFLSLVNSLLNQEIVPCGSILSIFCLFLIYFFFLKYVLQHHNVVFKSSTWQQTLLLMLFAATVNQLILYKRFP